MSEAMIMIEHPRRAGALRLLAALLTHEQQEGDPEALAGLDDADDEGGETSCR